MANETVKQIPIDDIYANSKWNARHGDWTKDFEIDTETPIFQALVESIKEKGIETPLLLRPNPDGKTPPYSLVCGYRRLAAAKLLQLKTVPAVIRHLDELDARISNIAENTIREDLKSADLAWACGELAKQGLKDDKIAVVVGKSISYVSKLTSIMSNVRAGIIKAWRDQKTNEVTVAEMHDLSLINKDQQDAQWAKLIGAHKAASKVGKGKGKWLKTLKSKGYNVGFNLGTLARCTFIKGLSDDWKGMVNAVIPLPKKATPNHEKAIAASMEEGFIEGMKEPPMEEEDDEAGFVVNIDDD